MIAKKIYFDHTKHILLLLNLSKIRFATNFPRNIFHKNAYISTYSPKIEFQRCFSTPGGVTFVQNLISYKKFPSE